MSYLKFKAGVVVSRQAVIAAAAINAAHQLGLTQDIVVTSGNDSTHKTGSKHYTNEALDIRTKTIPNPHTFAATIRKRLGRDYDVIFECEGQANEHLHCEYDP